MVQLLGLIARLAGLVDPEFFEHALVDLGENDGGVGVEPCQKGKRIEGLLGIFILDCCDRKDDQDLIEVEQGIALSQVVDHEILAGLDHHRGEEFDLFRNLSQVFERVQEQCARSAEEGRASA